MTVHLSIIHTIHTSSIFARKPANGLGLRTVGRRGLCSEAEKTRSQKMLINAAPREAAVPSVQCITLALGQCQGYPGARAVRCARQL